jgi:preprotein translocase subunit YajC
VGNSFFVIILVLLALMYFLMIRPQRARQRKQAETLNSVAPGDEIVTIGGIYGDVVEVDDEKLVVEIAEDIHIEIARKAIGTVVKSDERTADDKDQDDGTPIRTTKYDGGSDDKSDAALSTAELAERART